MAVTPQATLGHFPSLGSQRIAQSMQAQCLQPQAEGVPPRVRCDLLGRSEAPPPREVDVLGFVTSRPRLCRQTPPRLEKGGSGPSLSLRRPHCGHSPRLGHLSGSVARARLKYLSCFPKSPQKFAVTRGRVTWGLRTPHR